MTSSKLTILRGETLVENRCAFVGDSVFPSFEPFSIGSDCAAILDAVTLQLHVRNEQVNLSVVELQHRLSVSFFLNSQLLAFSFFFSFLFCFAREILSYLACTRHAPTDEMFVKERKSRERRSVPLCLVVAILRKRFDGIGKPFFPKKGVRMNATDRVIPRWCLFSIHTSRFIERSVALLRTICCLLFFAFSPTRTNTVRGGGNGASTHCHSYENEN